MDWIHILVVRQYIIGKDKEKLGMRVGDGKSKLDPEGRNSIKLWWS